MHPETVEPTDHSRLAWLQDELAAVRFAAHMPDDYEYGLPSWINQYLYAAYIGASFSEIVLEKIRQGRLTFPEAPSYQRMLALESENEALRAQVEKLRDDLAELKHVADEPQRNYLRETFGAQRYVKTDDDAAAPWLPPLDLPLVSQHGHHRYVLGRRKWKVQGGTPTLTHGGLSLLEVAVPFIELSRP